MPKVDTFIKSIHFYTSLVGFRGIINLCPLRTLCQKAFPASLNFSPEVKYAIINKMEEGNGTEDQAL
jgi:hypothetical protein